ncbi:MAG: hypothetical protein C5B49_10280 [Bdellovibrio sp.]|nr:MAG: hypothetical protein C5B49_10280 [Bdellovibrio sp.]
MKSVNSIFFRGFITLLPIAVTIYIIYSAILILENLLGSVIRWILPPEFYVPGLGFLLTIFLIFTFGLILNNFLAVRVMASLEQRLLHVPFIKAIYGPLKDLMNLISKKSEGLQSVVMVNLGNHHVLGIVTRENFADLRPEVDLPDVVAVYFPFSYALGGFTLLVPRSQLKPVNLPIEKAMSLAITAWVKAERSSTDEPTHE